MVRKPAEHTIELEREPNGRWVAEVITMPGVTASGRTPDEAMKRVIRLQEVVLIEI